MKKGEGFKHTQTWSTVPIQCPVDRNWGPGGLYTYSNMPSEGSPCPFAVFFQRLGYGSLNFGCPHATTAEADATYLSKRPSCQGVQRPFHSQMNACATPRLIIPLNLPAAHIRRTQAGSVSRGHTNTTQHKKMVLGLGLLGGGGGAAAEGGGSDVDRSFEDATSTSSSPNKPGGCVGCACWGLIDLPRWPVPVIARSIDWLI